MLLPQLENRKAVHCVAGRLSSTVWIIVLTGLLPGCASPSFEGMRMSAIPRPGWISLFEQRHETLADEQHSKMTNDNDGQPYLGVVPDAGCSSYSEPSRPLVELLPPTDWPEETVPPSAPPDLSLWQKVQSDHKNYYSADSLAWMTGGFAVGALMANTSIDDGIHRHFQVSVRSASSDDWFESLHAQKELGNGRYTIPVFAAAWAAGRLFDDVPVTDTVGEWGERSLRSILVGTPPLLTMQYVTGASRPGEASSDSKWKPFQDNNGVSGHSFMGAIPFLCAAKMTDRPLLKLAFYAGSTLAPLSRINDGAHYPSQALLGWGMAWAAATAVQTTETGTQGWSFLPVVSPNITGILAEKRW